MGTVAEPQQSYYELLESLGALYPEVGDMIFIIFCFPIMRSRGNCLPSIQSLMQSIYMKMKRTRTAKED